jgi:hypothetical protein
MGGIIKKTNGCTEHIIIFNELMRSANWHRENLILVAFDFTNAFGSVPHESTMLTMRQRKFPEWMQGIVKDRYQGTTSTIKIRGTRSNETTWKKGVKQGWPLSSVLFNLCLEPLLQAAEAKCGKYGAFVGRAEGKISFTVQVYADDIIVISREPKGIRTMLDVPEHFVSWS